MALQIFLKAHLFISSRLLGVKNVVESALELVSKELNHLAAILHVYAGSLISMK